MNQYSVHWMTVATAGSFVDAPQPPTTRVPVAVAVPVLFSVPAVLVPYSQAVFSCAFFSLPPQLGHAIVFSLALHALFLCEGARVGMMGRIEILGDGLPWKKI